MTALSLITRHGVMTAKHVAEGAKHAGHRITGSVTFPSLNLSYTRWESRVSFNLFNRAGYFVHVFSTA